MEGEPKGQDELQKSGRSSAEPEEKPPVAKTFTQEQVDKLLGEVQGKKDKTIASLTKERETLKSQLEEATTQVQQATELRKELEKQGIKIRAGSMPGLAEEAPSAYKDVDMVVETVSKAGIAKKVARLKPVAVIKG